MYFYAKKTKGTFKIVCNSLPTGPETYIGQDGECRSVIVFFGVAGSVAAYHIDMNVDIFMSKLHFYLNCPEHDSNQRSYKLILKKRKI